MRVLKLHDWDVSTAQAALLQRDLALRVVRSRCLFSEPRMVAGCDLSIDRLRGRGQAAVVVVAIPSMEPVEVRLAEGPLTWPYVPGYLSFRECPLVLEAFSRLDTIPDAVLVDGQGIAHPRRFGLASHLGLCLDLPTVGCAKSLLCGSCETPGAEPGSFAEVLDGDEVVAVALRTRTGVRPVFVSIGHKTDLAGAVEWVLHCTDRHRLPEPTRLAHLAAGGRPLNRTNDA
jgi:deoxyribonuclease V